MAKNLNHDAGTGSVCYNNIPQNCENYGRLYNWETAITACPSGWHLPSDAEWTKLLEDVGGTGTNYLTGAGAKLKTASGWPTIDGKSGNGTDSHGFAALPGSYGVSLAGYYSRGGYGTAKGSFFWSATGAGANGALIRHFGPTTSDAKRIDNDKSRLYSVRCVKD
jgi:uncharacterized protein (TIGR02145 family)